MNILFLDQSGNLGGAELSLADVAAPYRDRCLVGLFADGPFRAYLEQRSIPVNVLVDCPIFIQRTSGLLHNLGQVRSLLPLILQVAKIARRYDVIYANTQKALVVGAIASVLARRPLVYHLRDILSVNHFSTTNRLIAINLANLCASLVLANSEATRSAFVAAGGRSEITQVVYNGFTPEQYQTDPEIVNQLRHQLGLTNKFIVGHFSRLSPWKGQHILLDALTKCPGEIVALLVGDALFGEQEYVQQLQQQVINLGLQDRVRFLGFRSNVPELMAACHLITHTSTAPEPFGRVIVEGMLCDRPVIATGAGGAVELIEHGKTGWMCVPNDANQLAAQIMHCYQHPSQSATIAHQGKLQARQHFSLQLMNQKIAQLLDCAVQQPHQQAQPTQLSGIPQPEATFNHSVSGQSSR
jgi:glycosyltransferase involved in cell wall biosynthesis